ncbi:hypothetical protein [Luteibacter sp. dw_328]|uniref:hypothetical protein n=1 Tax=Luteibacter sp. dw_328 TaxID=2719796 RepID=UPI001BD2DC90|nr:hypothetical protein [Luteibacter sp. dw_328]
MKVTSSALTTRAYAMPTSMIKKPSNVSLEAKAHGSVGASEAIDFSNITPRKLHEYVDERLMSGAVDGPDGLYCTTLFDSIPAEWYAERPDVPMDLTKTIDSMAAFAHDNGFSKLVNLYDGLMDWMKMMEVQPAHISVIA